MQWDLFCRVIDNHGDLGVCWRLAADLAGRGETVRLWVDDASALAWMAPDGAPRVEVRAWAEAEGAVPAGVVVEAFGCELPAPFVARMAAAPAAPVWINLEYLSAENYVERSHRLPSPQSSGPGAGLTKWFFYPGFTPATGGLLREPDLPARQAAFDAAAWLRARGLERRWGERLVSLFCYPNTALPRLVEALAGQPTLLLATPGHAAAQMAALPVTGALRWAALPWLTQRDYDHLLWACDLNLVRGEDSFVRAQWAARPLVWQIYPQHDEAHRAKLEAFLARHLAGAAPSLADSCAALSQAWNDPDAPFPALPDPQAWAAQARAWRDRLLAQTDLVTQLLRFVAEKG